MARRDGCDVVYWAAQRWVDAALRKDDSLFTPGHSIWSLDNLDDFHQRVVGQPNAPGSGFFEKFESQLAEAPPETIQLAAEILYVHYLIASPEAIGGKNKRERIRQVIGWSTLDLSIPSDHDKALDVGILHPGAGFGPDKPAHVQLIAEFVQHWKRRPAQRHSSVLESPWVFKEEVQAIKVPKAGVQAEALLHLAHPDTFEPIVTSRHRELIRDAFSDLLGASSSDIDHDIITIRDRLNDRYGKGFDFYNPKIGRIWDSDMPAWKRLAFWSRSFLEHSDFDKTERYYKEEISNNIKKALISLESGSNDWLQLLRRAFGSPNNLTAWQAHAKFLDWCASHHEEARTALLEFWSGREAWTNIEDASVAVRRFLNKVPTEFLSGKHSRVNIASFLAMSVDPYSYPVYRLSNLEFGYNLTKYRASTSSASEAAVYQQALSFFDKMIEETRRHGLRLRDRLDAQSMLWVMKEAAIGDFLPEVEYGAFRRYRDHVVVPRLTFEAAVEDVQYTQGRAIASVTLPAASGGSGSLTYEVTPKAPDGLRFDTSTRTLSGTPAAARPATTFTYQVTDEDGDIASLTFSIAVEPETLEALADRLLWNPKHLGDIQRLLRDKRQVVFYGPPGTGKTYVALELARHFAGDGGSTDLVQFHPSYAYEDFVEGYRPADKDGQPGFELKPGPLKRIAETARDNPGATHVLVIDEINRGNVARVFGELYFLLEYRDRKMSLQYSEGRFTLPKNLWFIATMNTADRSIALVDAALRRRFHFVEFSPHAPPVHGLLRRWLEKDNPDLLWVARLVHLANDKLADRHLAIGPSHFMRKDLDENWVELIWNHSIYPYVEEQLFGDQDRLQEFKFESLKRAAQRQDRNPDDDDDTSDTG